MPWEFCKERIRFPEELMLNAVALNAILDVDEFLFAGARWGAVLETSQVGGSFVLPHFFGKASFEGMVTFFPEFLV